VRPAKLILVVLGLLIAACSSDKDSPATELTQQTESEDASVPLTGADENLTFEDDNLSFATDDGPAASENITFSDGFDNSTEENITFEPIDIPATDFSQAATETEPNQDIETASQLGAIAGSADGNPQFAAQGTLTGRDTDYFSFSVEGEAQLYLVEAIGPGVSRMTLLGAAGRIAYGKSLEDPTGSSLTSIYLAPGDYKVAVEQRTEDSTTSYTVRVVPMGVPDRYREREPNDVIADAESLVPDLPRTGLLVEPDDSDYYRFNLMAEQLVRIRVEPPPDLKLYFALKDNNQNLVSRIAAKAGDTIEYTAMLHPGNYNVVLSPKEGTSTAPYKVSLTTGNRFASIVDLEPNDTQHQAQALPPDGNVHGHAKDFGDNDWYRLPEIAEPTSLTIGSEAGKQRVFLHRLTDGWPKRASLEWSQDNNMYSGNLEPGGHYFLEISVVGDYAFQVGFDPEPIDWLQMATRATSANVRLQLQDSLPTFAAFWHESQRTIIPVGITNDGNEPVRLELAAATSHPGWQISGPPEPVEIAPRQTATVPVHVRLAPDIPAQVPVRFDFRVQDEHGASQLGSLSAHATCGAEPVNPDTIWTLPDRLVGGFNVAWGNLGSRVVDASDYPDGKAQHYLYDGLTPNDSDWARAKPNYPVDVTVELAGTEPVAVAGIILDRQAKWDPRVQARDFELFLSVDGIEYQKVTSGRLSRARIPQEFVLAESVVARFARLRVHSNFDPKQGRVALGEFAVVAEPAANPFAGQSLNLADPALGGYVAWSIPRFSGYREAEAMLTKEVEKPTLRFDPVIPTEWVIGFHHSRAAQISELQWVDSPETGTATRPDRVQVSVSTGSAVGPWTFLGNWELDRASGPTSTLRLAEPVWARFVRFVVSDVEPVRRIQVAETLRILERGVGPEYRSILAEWGKYSAVGPLEWTQEAARQAVRPSLSATDNVSKDRALNIQADAPIADEVELGVRTTWYRFDVPERDNHLQFSVFGGQAASIVATLERMDGTSVPLRDTVTASGELLLEATVEGGTSYWLRLSEPIRHVAVVWDNSGSVSPYFAAIYGAINKFVREIQPGNEFVQLLPFRESGFLLEDWSDQTDVLMKGLQADPRTESSSEAEEFLLRASTALGTQEGSKAIILVTDADSGGYALTPELWISLARNRPRVFTVELHRGGKARHQQDLMQSWASVNNGNYTHFSQQSDLDVAFDRAFCHLRRPVRFELIADSRFEEPPGPGWLSVEAGDAISANAVELILDASGSMLQRLDGTRRIEIARTVLTDLVNETIPEGTSLALRVFGHRKPDACDTDLAVPLQPLDRGKVTGVIQATQAMNLARTPIGESLARVADDLGGVDGQKLIILITDGEETCDGDPAGAIAELKEAGHDVRINIVGFAIDDAVLKADFESWARMGGGLYFNASSAEELDEALKEAMRPKFQVLDDTGAIVTAGTTGGASLELPSGTYTVKILTSPVQTFDDVRIEPEETTEVSAAAN